MANEFKISERQKSGTFVNGEAMPIQGRRVTGQEVDVTGTSTQSAAFNANTDYISLRTTADCYYLIGTNPTAVADDTSELLKAGDIVQEPVEEGEVIAVITA